MHVSHTMSRQFSPPADDPRMQDVRAELHHLLDRFYLGSHGGYASWTLHVFEPQNNGFYLSRNTVDAFLSGGRHIDKCLCISTDRQVMC
jgi:hypothetical protein